MIKFLPINFTSSYRNQTIRQEFPYLQQPCPIVDNFDKKKHLQTIRQEFPYLQQPCPIVDNFEKRQNFQQPIMPNGNRNYVLVDPIKVDFFVKQGENALPYLSEVLTNSNNESQVTETLYILDKMLDNGTKNIDKMYPVLSRFNNTQSPNIQTFLAGIYRKTQVPDAFGPLVKMLIQNSLKPQTSNFDPNEEIGGAILSYVSDRFR